MSAKPPNVRWNGFPRMTDYDNHFGNLVVELQAQAAMLASLRTDMDHVEAEVESTDKLVKVRVNATGTILKVQLASGTSTLGRDQLGELITTTAQAAARQAAADISQRLRGLVEAHDRLLDAVEGEDGAVVSALRDIAASTEPPPSPSPHAEVALDEEDDDYLFYSDPLGRRQK